MEAPQHAANENGHEVRKISMFRPEASPVIRGSDPSLLGQWSTVTGWHGISDAYLAPNVSWRIMWVLVVLVTMAVGMNQTVSMIMDYVNDDKWTSSITLKSVPSLPVPTFYVCSLNVYNQSAFAENGLTADKVIENAGSNANVPPSILSSFGMERPDENGKRPHMSTPRPRFPGGFPQMGGQFGQNGQFGPGQGQGQGQGGFSGGQNGFGNQNSDQKSGMQMGNGGGQGGMGGGQGQMGGGQMGGFGGQQGGMGGGMGGMVGMGGGFGRKRRETNPDKSKKVTKTAKGAKSDKGTRDQTTVGPFGSKQKDTYDDLYASMENSTMQCSAMIIGCGPSSQLTWSGQDKNESVVNEKCCEGSQMDDEYCFNVDLKYPFEQMLNAPGGEIQVANSENSIYLLMDPRLSDYMKEMVPGERPGQGFRLYFGQGYDAKYYSKPILISPGSYSLIELTYERTHTQLTREKGLTAVIKSPPPCITKAEYSYVTEKTYQKWACEADCQISTEIEKCNCTTVEGDFRPREIYCHNNTARNLCKRVITLEKNKPESPYHKCKMRCNESCDWDSISSVVSSTTFPAPSKIEALRGYLNINNRNFTAKQVEKLALVEIYYGSLFIRLTERMERSTVNELISNIGGALGAWAGISLITIYQAIVYMAMGCMNMIVERRALRRAREELLAAA